MEKNVVFSVIVPMYNAQNYIIESLESIVSQSFHEYEVIIVDDCSTDNSNMIVRNFIKTKPEFRLVKNKENIGVAVSRNYGITLAIGEFIAFLDADDVWLSEKLAMQYEILKTREYDFCYTSYEYINEQSKKLNLKYITKDRINYQEMLSENYIGCSTFVIKREILSKYKFNSLYSHEDYSLWLDLLHDSISGIGLLDVLVLYRSVKGSRSNNKLIAAKNRYRVLSSRKDLNWFNSKLYFLKYIKSSLIKYVLK